MTRSGCFSLTLTVLLSTLMACALDGQGDDNSASKQSEQSFAVPPDALRTAMIALGQSNAADVWQGLLPADATPAGAELECKLDYPYYAHFAGRVRRSDWQVKHTLSCSQTLGGPLQCRLSTEGECTGELDAQGYQPSSSQRCQKGQTQSWGQWEMTLPNQDDGTLRWAHSRRVAQQAEDIDVLVLSIDAEQGAWLLHRAPHLDASSGWVEHAVALHSEQPQALRRHNGQEQALASTGGCQMKLRYALPAQPATPPPAPDNSDLSPNMAVAITDDLLCDNFSTRNLLFHPCLHDMAPNSVEPLLLQGAIKFEQHKVHGLVEPHEVSTTLASNNTIAFFTNKPIKASLCQKQSSVCIPLHRVSGLSPSEVGLGDCRISQALFLPFDASAPEVVIALEPLDDSGVPTRIIMESLPQSQLCSSLPPDVASQG